MPTKKTTPLADLLLDPDAPFEMRRQILRQLLFDEEQEASAILQHVLDAATSAKAGEQLQAKRRELSEVIKQMMEGPLRQGTFVSLLESKTWGRRAEVLLPDGGSAFTPVPDAALASQLRCGDLVWLEAQGKALLYRQSHQHELGDEAQLERRLPDGTVEVQIGEQGKFVFRAAAELDRQLEAGEASPGSAVIVCQRRRFAFRALPREEGFARFRYLSLEPVPDVDVERDIGSPPAFIDEFTRHMRRELTDASLAAHYGLRRSRLRLLTGVPGTGKTFSIQGFWRRMYSVLSELAGVPVDELPPRVLQLRVPEILSKWVGVSDQNIARFFDEATQLASETFTTPDGRDLELPLLIVIEECDAWARERGEDPIHDRIQTTLLTNLDPSRGLFRDRLVFVLCTTNTPQLVDSAFVRRVGGMVDTFGRMDRGSFRAVLEKQIAGRPFRLDGATTVAEARGRAVADLVAWLFGPNSADPGVVEITYVGQTNAVTRHRRDFLTAALVDRAVQAACAEACDAEWLGAADPGLSGAALMAAVDAQVRPITLQLSPRNCDRYLTLPEGVRVAAVRRLEQPAALPLELERAS